MASRPRSSRLRRALLTALVTASVALPVSGAARPAAVPAPAPADLGPLGAATPAALGARYAAGRDGIRAAGQAALQHGDRQRAASLRAMAAPGRHFLAFDGRDGGRTAEVFGDLSRAHRIAVLVPGAGVDHYARLRHGGEALLGELGGGSAVVAWLGYRTPATLAVFFLVGGQVGAGGYASARARGDSYGRWLRTRMGRLFRPVAVVPAVWAVAAGVMLVSGVDRGRCARWASWCGHRSGSCWSSRR